MANHRCLSSLRPGAVWLTVTILAWIAGCRANEVTVPADGGGETCSVSPTSLDFGAVALGSSSDRSFTISNPGASELLLAVTESHAEFAVISGGGESALAPDSLVQVVVRYTPASAGSASCTISTGSDDCGGVVCQGVGTTTSESGGYTLFSPNNGRASYLVDMDQNIVHQWSHTRTGGYSVYLLDDGTILRTAASSGTNLNGGGAQGVVERVNAAGSVVWEYTYSTSAHRSHHDIEPMPNGHVLLIAWEVKSAAQAVQAGRSSSREVWPDHVIEVSPSGSSGGTIVWEWHAWDHLIQDHDPSKDNYGVVAAHPELLDVNLGSSGGLGAGDWMHLNGISYRPDWDQIVLSSHELDEIYVIDHSTTTAEAAGHEGGRSGRGGDLLYRWGCPANYDADGTRVFNVVHCSVWIPDGLPGAGHILAFNNREGQGTSMVVELTLPADAQGGYQLAAGTAYGPSEPSWSYTASGFYSNHLGGCQRLPDGNTLIVESTSGRIFEVDPSGTVVWDYARGGEIARALRYAADDPGITALRHGSAARL